MVVDDENSPSPGGDNQMQVHDGEEAAPECKGTDNTGGTAPMPHEDTAAAAAVSSMAALRRGSPAEEPETKERQTGLEEPSQPTARSALAWLLRQLAEQVEDGSETDISGKLIQLAQVPFD